MDPLAPLPNERAGTRREELESALPLLEQLQGERLTLTEESWEALDEDRRRVLLLGARGGSTCGFQGFKSSNQAETPTSPQLFSGTLFLFPLFLVAAPLKWSSQKRVPFFSRVTEQLRFGVPDTCNGCRDGATTSQLLPRKRGLLISWPSPSLLQHIFLFGWEWIGCRYH